MASEATKVSVVVPHAIVISPETVLPTKGEQPNYISPLPKPESEPNR